MKTKPILIMVAVLATATCNFLFSGCKTAKTTGLGDVKTFLADLNKEIKAKDVDDALGYFYARSNKAANKALVNVLCGKSRLNGKGKPLFGVSLNVEDAIIAITDPRWASATIDAEFKRPNLEAATSKLIFTLHKDDDGEFKIASVKTDVFAEDYDRYQSLVIFTTQPEEDVYSAETLAAFRKAKQLKTRYDSIIWFQHIDKKTWFYVVQGTLPEYFDWGYPVGKPKGITYKMGLVGPDMKEIIPAEYDMLHNIGGSVDKLVEVEKNDKKGLFDLAGRPVAPAIYDLILPLKEGNNLALMQSGNDFFYLDKNLKTSNRLPGFKIADALPNVKYIAANYKLTEQSYKNTMEYNSPYSSASLIVSPSYLVEWDILPMFIHFPNSQRHTQYPEEGGSLSMEVTYNGPAKEEDGNWLQSAYYSVVNDYLGGRGDLYESKNVLAVDKKRNKVVGIGASIYQGLRDRSDGPISGACDQNRFRSISDSLYEYRITASLGQHLFTEKEYIAEGPYYTFLKLVNGKPTPLISGRIFPTQFIKLNDSYLSDCYLLRTTDEDDSKRKSRTISYATPEMLQAMKNEIYASYRYRFKNKRWNDVFPRFLYDSDEKRLNDNVDDSLTAIDKYNIEFLNRKLKITKPATLALR